LLGGNLFQGGKAVDEKLQIVIVYLSIHENF